MNVAVTGAGGFVGRHVCAALEKNCICPVRHFRSEGSIEKEEPVNGTSSFDLKSPPSDFYGRLGRPEAVIHLAWGGLPNYDSRHHFEVEVPLHFNFLKKLVESGTRKLVLAGTCFEYGLKNGCLAEGDSTDPCNPYGFAKDSLRRQLEFLSRELDFELVWLRLFYLYGEGQPERSLFGLLDAAIERGDSEFPMSGGEQLRDYLPIEDAADMIVSLTCRAGINGIFNIASGDPISVRRLVEQRIAESDSKIRPVLGALPYSKHEAMSFWGSRERLDGLLSG